MVREALVALWWFVCCGEVSNARYGLSHGLVILAGARTGLVERETNCRHSLASSLPFPLQEVSGLQSRDSQPKGFSLTGSL